MIIMIRMILDDHNGWSTTRTWSIVNFIVSTTHEPKFGSDGPTLGMKEVKG